LATVIFRQHVERKISGEPSLFISAMSFPIENASYADAILQLVRERVPLPLLMYK
jgi:hypothetical protein